jgi:hypothetical protein
VGDLEKLARLQQGRGDAVGAAKTLEALKEALDLQERLAAVSKKMRAEATDAAVAKQETTFRREIFRLEAALQKAVAETGDAQSAKVKALEDELAVKRLAVELQDTLSLSEADALKLAKDRVAFERQAGESQDRRQRQSSQREATEALFAEMQILRAQSSGRQELAQKLQRELEIRRETKRIIDDTGISEEKALALAREKDRLNNPRQKRGDDRYDENDRRRSDGRKRIRGYSFLEQGTSLEAVPRADERRAAARARAEQRTRDSRARIQTIYNRHFGGLDPFYGRPGSTFGNLTNPLADRASQNAGREDGGGTAEIVKAVMETGEKTVAILSEALS